MTYDYDVVVLGAGSGGYTAAVRAAQLGLSVAVVEERHWGGTCLNLGCIPSKALLHNAELATIVTRDAALFGIRSAGPITVSYEVAFERSRAVAAGRVKGVHHLMRKWHIDEINGSGRFQSAHDLVVTGDDGARRITFGHCIIGVGATTRLLPGTTLSERVVTYEQQIRERALPGSVIIVGAGAIGVEFAYLMRSFGTDVTLIEHLDRLVPLEDHEISAELARRFRNLGIATHTSTSVESIDDSGDQVAVTITSTSGRQVLRADKVLQAVGFQPRVDGYGLEHTGVRLTDRRAIDVDLYCRTNVPNIFAIGDVTAKLMLAHVADAMGVVAAETIAGQLTQVIDYAMVPRVTYCQPQVASFGWTEAQALEHGCDVTVAKFPFTANGKAHGAGDTSGFVKLVADASNASLLGGHLIGHDVSELLPELTLAQQYDLTAHDLAHNIHAHPTMSEGVKEAIHGLVGQMINL